jgi:tripartite-type tricarboxylate transporter receptor subunit TctC
MGTRPYKIEDFEWVVRLMSVPSYLFVIKDSPIKNGEEFVRIAKERELKIAIAGYNTLDDLAVKMMIKKGVKLVPVVFSKPNERYASPLGGHVDVLLEQTGDVRSFLDAGQMRPILIFEKKRNPLYPDLPTLYELGVEVAIPPNFRCIVTKAGVPEDRKRILADAFKQVVATPEWKAFVEKQECAPDSYMGPTQFPSWVAELYEDLKEMVKATGVRQK